MFYHLQVDRLDEAAVGTYYFRLGTNPEKVHQRVERRLAEYRAKGFVIAQFDNRDGYWRANRSDGVMLELMLVERDYKLPPIIYKADFFEGGDDGEVPTYN